MSIIAIKSLEEFNKLLSENARVVVKFEADWCGPCHAFAPTYEKIALAHASRIVFAKVDVDEASDVAAQEKITCMPTMKTYYKGNAQNQILGASEKELQSAVNSLQTMD
mmetsp:Transcript_24261/g.37820  ORF Transcript_24261/g.37820 Transcript_24261/m.37820 type:complete len:109 (-) Transcript_24261:73-399(-)